MALDPTVRAQLLALARQALEARVREQQAPEVPEQLNVPASGLFVTITHAGQLRGCLGTLSADQGLAEATTRLAGDVSRDDSRFRPVTPGELDDITIDLSVLTPTERVDDPATIEVGRHGLIVQQGGRRGLLLPQVATEHGWDRETFLAQTCMKAGLPPDAWRRGATVYRFEAEVFSEEDE
ncbi:MAG TPA: AmmeMemoRadiSam system protein A [Vicinamibacterales bacterium]|nr:AmmeMemoRadiSam system protein A [Vicinamibacterales bacterium]